MFLYCKHKDIRDTIMNKKDVPLLLPEEIYTVKIRRCAVTGVAWIEQWAKDGLPHREDGPAFIQRDPVTGVIVQETWVRNNEPDRDDGPADILRKPDGRVYYSAWWRKGEKIAPPKPTRKIRATASRRASSLSLGPTG
jgi:hypothetical protein